ncbi:RHS repeat protein [Flavobacterium amniphilum]|uniref:RHS repeat domain-containing protein n=1 Tax=Flavobacterium amniphilum TaxID=1834035 RepID=UPI002029DCB9|nr:RHS repeat domain-containing protein [Flavobacterium amniphilum]MCL9807681.1 RHS repeat protein [Flavobacterium amniphilum]
MNTSQQFQRAIATFFLLIFFPTLIPANLYASNNGPKSPEAASFEPVDATDMVNLITGQYSYVLPLLNVPSPEGGYPLAMGYHAGIAMDQESSWTGLGWNVNPGAIDRSINGYPDDYSASHLNEYFWDRTHTVSSSYISTGYSNGIFSVGMGFNWGSHQSLGGHVSVGVGYKIDNSASLGANATVSFGDQGTNVQIGVGYTSSSGLTLGVSADSNGDVGINAGYNNNGNGFSVGYNTNGTHSLGFDFNGGDRTSVGLDVTLSSKGVGLRAGVTNKTKHNSASVGSGMFMAFNNTVSMGDYCLDSAAGGWMYNLTVPTPIGVFNLNFGKQEFRYWLGKNVENYVTGPINYHKGIVNQPIPAWIEVPPYYETMVTHNIEVRCTSMSSNGDGCQYQNQGVGPHGHGYYHRVNVRCENIFYSIGYTPNGHIIYTETGCPHYAPHNEVAYPSHWGTITPNNAFMDISEITVSDNEISSNVNVAGNNMTFPNYDNYAVSGQGISGNMMSTLYKNGVLFGLDGRENKDGLALKYNVRPQNASGSDFTKFNSRPQFEFNNEISTYLKVDPALFNANASNATALNYYSSGIDLNDKPRRRTSSYIDYFTNDEIINNYTTLKNKGFLQANVSGLDRSVMPKDGIGAFKITAVDGKTYHYSLPVYNHEIITRTNGVIPESVNEWESYFEKRQLDPFATHWMLTAVTGPDYVDNGDGVAGDGDLGYWTSFEYGKWTDAFVWKNPYKKDKFIDEKNPLIQTWIRGRKQLYYLDKIKTRTHTALFIKSARQDAPSPQWNYDAAEHVNDKENNGVSNRFIVPSQNQLRLDKILLLKNSDQTAVDKASGPDANQKIFIKYNQSVVKEMLEAKFNCYDNVLDSQDNWQIAVPKALKVIDFNYDYSLVPGDSRLTLKSVDFKGKAGASVLPPYQFEYLNNPAQFDIEDKNAWGYNSDNQAFFSLKKITTPQGGTIEVDYADNSFHTVTPHSVTFSNKNKNETAGFGTQQPSISGILNFRIKSKRPFGIAVGSYLDIVYHITRRSRSGGGNVGVSYECDKDGYTGQGIVTQSLGNNEYIVQSTGNIVDMPCTPSPALGTFVTLSATFNVNASTTIAGGGPRVQSLKVSDGVNNFITDYKYGQNEDGVGHVSYIPYSPNVDKEVPYSSELPAPRVMYEYVSMSSHKQGVASNGKIRYRFNVLKEKSPNKIKYGEFYEINKTSNPTFVNTANNKDVSINSYVVKENFAALGQLLEVVTLNPQGQLLSKVYSDYYNKSDIPANIGIVQESYQSYKEVDYTNNSIVRDKWVINSSTRIKYPSIVKSSTEEKGGQKYTTEYKDWDLVSGISKEQIYTSSDGRSFKVKVVPAYTKYGTMGSKVDDVNNRNMLSQTTAEFSYILDNGAWKETGVGITTWNNNWTYQDIEGNLVTPTDDKEKVWRKHKNYIWNGLKDSNGIFQNYNSTTDDGFDWTVGVGSQPVKWKQISEVTKYDHYSMALEAKDINNNHAATKMGDKESKITAIGTAKYNELYYSGLENVNSGGIWLEPGMSLSGATLDNTKFHTGKYSVSANNVSRLNIDLKDNQHKAGRYRLNVWVHKDKVSYARILINGVMYTFNGETKQAGDWVLKAHYFDLTTAAATVSLTCKGSGVAVNYDDIMLRPIASSVVGYVYDEWDELSHIVGNNGLATRFEYDAAGRLVKSYVEVFDDQSNGLTGGFKLSSENKTKYKNL